MAMEENANNIITDFDLSKESPRIIKVIGVGGGGGNAVKHMFKQGNLDVTYVLCNTDSQALVSSEIPNKIQIGSKTTAGLGAGSDPQVGLEAAQESIDEIKSLFTDGTQMVFITAGMGGGTGTGAAPFIAKTAKEMDMLTVGIVTIPFLFEKRKKIIQALEGVERMRDSVDALLVINNERLREIYTDSMTTLAEAYEKADDILSVATKSIAEIITMNGHINLDFRDVKKILKDGGVAIMSTGTAKGEKRLKSAIENALNSPLLNNNDIVNAKKILFNISSSDEMPILIEEMNEIDSFMDSLDPNIEVIWGQGNDQSLGEYIKFTVLATGFGSPQMRGIDEYNSYAAEVEREKNAEQEEIDQKKIEQVYGASSLTKTKPAYKIYIFSQEDLDDQEVISRVENSPTYNRTKGELQSIRASVTEEPAMMQKESEENGVPDSGVITF